MRQKPTQDLEISPLRALLATLAIACALVLAGAPAVRAAETVEGTIVVRHSDDFNGNSSHSSYLLERDEQPTLRLIGVPQSDVEPGRRVEVTGEQTENTLRVSDIEASGDESSQRLASNSREVAVVLLNFTNDLSEPWTPAEIEDKVFTGSSSVNQYFQEQSSGELELTGRDSPDGDVYGWNHINLDNSDCQYGQWETAALQQAGLPSNPSSAGYDHYVFMWPNASSCNWAGLAYLPGSKSYINGTSSLRVISHELGHNLGIHHASSYRCTDSNGQRTFVSSSCTASEYGDPFTVMGAAATYHSHALAKRQLGFLPSANMQTVTTSGSYPLVDSEQSVPGQTQLLRLPRTVASNGYVSQYYYLDLRRPFGTLFDTFGSGDAVVNGVSIRLAPDTPSKLQAKLLDANPSSLTFGDSALAVGQSATDPVTGVTFKTTTASTGSATVEVSIPAPSIPTDDSPGSASPSPATPQPATAPQVTYSTSAKRVLKTRKLTVTAKCSQRCRLSARGTVRSGRFKAASRAGSGVAIAGQRATIVLRWPRKALAATRKAFARGRPVSVELKLEARSDDGKVTRTNKRLRISG